MKTPKHVTLQVDGDLFLVILDILNAHLNGRGELRNHEGLVIYPEDTLSLWAERYDQEYLGWIYDWPQCDLMD